MADFATNAFNGVMGSFLEQLTKAFPREDSIKQALVAFNVMAKSKDSDKMNFPRTEFMEAVRPHSKYIRARDNDYMSEHLEDIAFLKAMNLKRYWDSPHMPPETRESIWAHLGQLLMLGTAIENAPPEIMPMVGELYESMADSGALDAMANGSASADGGVPPDMAKMLQTMAKKFMGPKASMPMPKASRPKASMASRPKASMASRPKAPMPKTIIKRK